MLRHVLLNDVAVIVVEGDAIEVRFQRELQRMSQACQPDTQGLSKQLAFQVLGEDLCSLRKYVDAKLETFTEEAGLFQLAASTWRRMCGCRGPGRHIQDRLCG